MRRLVSKVSAGLLASTLLFSGLSSEAEVEAKTAAVLQPEVVYAIKDISSPWGLAETQGSGIIVVSTGTSSINRWLSSGISVIAGQAGSGFKDGFVSQSAFNTPSYAAVDSKGNIYISDTENHVIRKITASRVFTLAGNGIDGYKDGKQDKAQFFAPGGLAVDADDNLYVADTLNHVIRKITPDGDVSTFAGEAAELGGYKDGTLADAKFNEPMGLAFDEQGRLYVADSGNHLIRVISEGVVSTYAGKPTKPDSMTGYMEGGYVNGAAEQARFHRPRDIAYVEGVLFVADSLNHRIRAVQPSGIVITIAGEGTPGDAAGAAAEAQFNEPSALLYADGELFVSDYANDSVKSIALTPQALQPIVTDEDLVEAVDLLPAAESVQGWINGALIPFTEEKQPYFDKERLYIPIRPLFEAWGAEVEWMVDTREAVITKGEWSRTFAVNEEQSTVLAGGTMYADLDSLLSLSLFTMLYNPEYNAVIVVEK